MHILITGGAGFLGQRLARQLLHHPQVKRLTLADVMTLPNFQNTADQAANQAANQATDQATIVSRQVDLTNAKAVKALITPDITAVYHLAAVVSSQAEAKFDLGVAVNADGTRNLLEAIRHQATGAQLIFASSLAVFGGELPDVITDKTAVTPQSSYGTQKAIAELWVNDYTRKGFINGVVLRLPTVVVRPGKPNAAASSFASSIIREPLNGQAAICPVDTRLPLWLASPETVTANLVHALSLSNYNFEANRTINLPGLTLTVQAMVESLVRVSGQSTADFIQYEPEESISRIVASWPSQFEVNRAIALGFTRDRSFEDIIHAFIKDNLT
ncbi:MAG: Nucleoside-diphosphate-sugar epimerase [Phormidesmis priestleyi Ana]|uniref:Nucleoside-diphosphate-sugar epimerase n=1 Tax=Phormidesmis priestleyi Ana TaxID=1666911 RepID=A0A0P7ZHT5_9CYAN|nr:MAG: Nucleoside-diphosphate-sugar epimerase [Phormidesmis priestleyi Ana]